MLFELLDKLAGWWLDRRTDRAIARDQELQSLGIKRAEIDETGFHLVASFPGVVLLADEAARMLSAHNAENYVEFDLMPRIDRGFRPVRVTVQWASGTSPAQKAAALERELAELRAARTAEG